MIKKIYLLCLLLWSLAFLTLAALSQPIKVGEVAANPGEKKSGFILVPAGQDGSSVKIPVTVINGVNKGPILALIAGIHGYEYPPILALQRLHFELDPTQLSGAVILVHIANVPSFLKRTIYYNPYDWKNLNRVFPGKKNGTMSERIAFQITKEVIDKCDYLIDNHCGDGNEDLMPYLYCAEIGQAEVDAQTRELAVNYGIRVIVHETDRPLDREASIYCDNTALVRGKPALGIESGKLGRTDEEDVKLIIDGTYNILKHLKMIPGEPVLEFKPIWVEKLTVIRSHHTGLFYPLVHRGYYVKKDEVIGYVTDFFGNKLELVRAPYDGIVLYIISTPPMSKGEPLVSIGGF